MSDHYKPEEISCNFMDLENDSAFKFVVEKAMSNLPKNIVDWASENAVFVPPIIISNFLGAAITKEHWDSCLKESGWDGKRGGFVFLAEDFKKSCEESQIYLVAHELAHLYLHHSYTNESREREADVLVEEWLGNELFNKILFLGLMDKIKNQINLVRNIEIREIPLTTRSL